jgi:hypothetical protein
VFAVDVTDDPASLDPPGQRNPESCFVYVTGATLAVDGGIGAGTLAVCQDKRRPG